MRERKKNSLIMEFVLYIVNGLLLTANDTQVRDAVAFHCAKRPRFIRQSFTSSKKFPHQKSRSDSLSPSLARALSLSTHPKEICVACKSALQSAVGLSAAPPPLCRLVEWEPGEGGAVERNH